MGNKANKCTCKSDTATIIKQLTANSNEFFFFKNKAGNDHGRLLVKCLFSESRINTRW